MNLFYASSPSEKSTQSAEVAVFSSHHFTSPHCPVKRRSHSVTIDRTAGKITPRGELGELEPPDVVKNFSNICGLVKKFCTLECDC